MQPTTKTPGNYNDAAAGVSSSVSSPANQGGSGLPTSIAGIVKKRAGVKPGTIRGSYHKPGRTSAGPSGDSRPDPRAVAAPVFTPEDTGLLVELPFNLALLKTGWTGFSLTPMEKETLSRTGTVVLNQWVTIDPKYVALIVFSLALMKTAGEKVFGYRLALLELEKANAASSGKPAPAAAAPAAEPGVKS